jgi:hypothetical protein
MLTSDVFYKMDSSKDTDMKRKVFPQSLPRERDSYQSIHKASSHIIKRHFVYLYLGLIIKNIAMESWLPDRQI